MDSLGLALRALARGLEDSPGDGVGNGERSARGARQAHDILLSRGL